LGQGQLSILPIHSTPISPLLHPQKSHLLLCPYIHPNPHLLHQRYHYLQHLDYCFDLHSQGVFLSFSIEFQVLRYRAQPSFAVFFTLPLTLSSKILLSFSIFLLFYLISPFFCSIVTLNKPQDHFA
jgi:hypothetical protein